MKQYILPKKILSFESIENIDSLFIDKDKYACIIPGDDKIKFCSKIEGKGAHLLIDFGKEMHGGIRFITDWVQLGSCKVRIRFGESYGEVNSSIGEKNATNDCSPRDFEYVIPAYGDIIIGATGFRFVRIDVLEDKYIFIKNIFCENHILSKPLIYKYKGEDKLIKQIFNTAKRTVDLCSSGEVIWDGIKRDRLLWIGDLAPEVMALTSMYGRVKTIETSLERAVKMYPLPGYMNNMFSYSLWWLIILGIYYNDLKCSDYVKKHLDYMQGLIAQLDKDINDRGEIPTNVRSIVDWPSVGSVDENVGNLVIVILSLNSVENIFDDFNLDKTHLINVRNKAYLNDLSVKEMKQIIGLKYAATGKMSDEEYETLIRGGAKGFSTFMSYYILNAIASRDEQLAIKLMKDYYGAMLSRGATTFFEDFDIEWLDNSGRIDEKTPEGLLDLHGDFGKHCYVGYRHSLCHGWSSGVIKFIKEHCK